MRHFPALLITLFSLWITPLISEAQSDSGSKDQQPILGGQGFAVSFVPQTFIKNGLRFDGAYFFKGARHSLTLAPVIYEGEPNRDNINNPELTGWGAELIHKIYFTEPEALEQRDPDSERAVYIGHGPIWRSFSVEYGLSNDGQQGTLQTRDINKYGYSIMFGVTLFTDFSLFLDFYAGGGLRRTSISTTDPNLSAEAEVFERSILDYEFSGILPVSGFKVGIKF